MTLTLPPAVTSNVTIKSKHSAWLATIEARLTKVLADLRADLLEQIPSDWSVVLKCRDSDGARFIVKAAPPDEEVIASIASLSFSHPKLVKCVSTDLTYGIQVLEHIDGSSFPEECNTPDELSKVGALLGELHRLPIHPAMISLEDWCRDLLVPMKNVPDAILENQERCRILLATSQQSTWLHGDLHHRNIMQDELTGALIAIDPKGIYGDASFDICTFVRNHVPEDLDDSQLTDLLETRITVIGATAYYPLNRAFAWAAAGNALSLSWDWPDSDVAITQHHMHHQRILMRLNHLAERYGDI
jgi:hypothetical protein